MLTPGVCVRVLRVLTNHVSVVSILANQSVRTPGVCVRITVFVSGFVSGSQTPKQARGSFENAHSHDD